MAARYKRTSVLKALLKAWTNIHGRSSPKKEAYSKEYYTISTDLTLKKLYESYFMSISLALQNNHSLKQQLPEGLSRVLYPIHGSPKGEQVNPNRSRVVWEYLNVPAKRRIELTEYIRFSFLMDAIMTCRFSRA